MFVKTKGWVNDDRIEKLRTIPLIPSLVMLIAPHEGFL